jgi:glycosyltransferase involved in cell wall biosynthesis
MSYQVLKFLQSKGHRIRILHNRISESYMFDGLEVMPKSRNIIDLFQWADVVFTHLDFAKWSTHLARMTRRPLYFFSHNSSHFYDEMMNDNRNTRAVYNCNAIKDLLKYDAPSFVLHPPCDWRWYDVSATAKPEYITLINLNSNKGSLQFYDIARAMPHKKFIGVVGSYDEQIIERLPNVEIVEKMVDIRPVYERTRILLMPSEYESWGRTATEAMCSGIPVIATPTFGLKENIGEGGIFIEDRDDIGAWVKAIERLDKEANYKTASEYAFNRSRGLDPVNELEEFNKFLCATCYL